MNTPHLFPIYETFDASPVLGNPWSTHILQHFTEERRKIYLPLASKIPVINLYLDKLPFTLLSLQSILFYQ
jgi:hypothetical protein